MIISGIVVKAEKLNSIHMENTTFANNTVGNLAILIFNHD